MQTLDSEHPSIASSWLTASKLQSLGHCCQKQLAFSYDFTSLCLAGTKKDSIESLQIELGKLGKTQAAKIGRLSSRLLTRTEELLAK